MGSPNQLLPVAMDMRGTVREREVYQFRVDHLALLSPVEEVFQVAEMSIAATNSVSRLVLIESKYLTWTEPSLKKSDQLR